MLKLSYSKKFKKDYLRMEKRGMPMEELKMIVTTIQKQIPLDAKYKDHALKGAWKNYRECHIRPDWLLIYTIRNQEVVLVLSRMGTHADLFNM